MKRTSILRILCVAVASLVVAVAAALIALPAPYDQAPADAASPNSSTSTSTSSTSSTSTSSTSTSTSTPTSTSTSTSSPATTSSTTPTTVAPDPHAAGETLRRGDRGAAVAQLQRRLVALGYWLGEPDGTYGFLAEQAVVAFQKVAGLTPDGVAGAGTQAALAAAERPSPASGSGNLVEVDKARQVMFVVRGGQVKWVLNVSTGTEQPYEVDGRTEMADTPVGHWNVGWAVDGVDVGPLGGLYRPRYFHQDGIAVHGYHSVPSYAASHGCVRVSEAAMDWIWANNLMPIGSEVWVY
jgi:peptidoglycan hydrolase-like protein with peptidoglycan-binding domain